MSDATWNLDTLVAAAKTEMSPRGAEARGWHGFAAAVQAGRLPIVPGDPIAGAAPVGAGGLVKGVVALVLTAAITAGGAAALEEREAPVRARVVDTRSAAPRTATIVPPPAVLPAVAPRAASVVPQTIAVPASSATPRTRVVSRPAPPIASAATPVADEDLLADARLVGAAWMAIREGRVDDALAGVRAHAQRFPNSLLAPERDACEVVARCRRGDADAQRRAAVLLPTLVEPRLADRVRAACSAATRDGLDREPAAKH